MSTTPDRAPGPSHEEELILEDQGASASPSTVGSLLRAAGDILARDSLGVFNIRGGGALTEALHEALDTLTHDLSETYNVTYAFDARGVCTSARARDASSVDVRAADNLVSSAAGLISGVRLRQFDAAGALKNTLQLSVTFSGGAPSMVTWSKS